MGMIRDLRSGEALGEMDYASSVLPTEHPAISLNEVKLGHAAQKDNPQGTPIRSHLAHGAVLETWSRPAACPLLRNERRRADWNRPPPELTAGCGSAHPLRHCLSLGGVDERPLAVLRRDISDPLFDLGLDLGVLLDPRHDLLTAALRQFAALHLSEHQLADELLLRELLIIPVEIGSPE